MRGNRNNSVHNTSIHILMFSHVSWLGFANLDILFLVPLSDPIESNTILTLTICGGVYSRYEQGNSPSPLSFDFRE